MYSCSPYNYRRHFSPSVGRSTMQRSVNCIPPDRLDGKKNALTTITFFPNTVYTTNTYSETVSVTTINTGPRSAVASVCFSRSYTPDVSYASFKFQHTHVSHIHAYAHTIVCTCVRTYSLALAISCDRLSRERSRFFSQAQLLERNARVRSCPRPPRERAPGGADGVVVGEVLHIRKRDRRTRHRRLIAHDICARPHPRSTFPTYFSLAVSTQAIITRPLCVESRYFQLDSIFPTVIRCLGRIWATVVIRSCVSKKDSGSMRHR